jgi:hypothetical protein
MNKARENLRAIMSWAWEQDYVEKLPRFPKPKPQRDVAGRHYLTKSDLNALYFATHQPAAQPPETRRTLLHRFPTHLRQRFLAGQH